MHGGQGGRLRTGGEPGALAAEGGNGHRVQANAVVEVVVEQLGPVGAKAWSQWLSGCEPGAD